jgi:4'-phosphopantetheinyl transferase EntD
MTGAGSRSTVVLCDWQGTEAPEAMLGPRERELAGGMSGTRRRQWIQTRLTAKAALGLLSWPTAVEILPDAVGAPCVAGPYATAVGLSLSHSGNLSACAVALGVVAVGVDVEPVDERNDMILRRVAHADDHVPIRSRRPGAEATLLFTCKESAFKTLRGSSPVLRDYRISRVPTGLRVHLARASASELFLWPLLTSRLAIAFCSDRAGPPLWRRMSPARVLATLVDHGARERR